MMKSPNVFHGPKRQGMVKELPWSGQETARVQAGKRTRLAEATACEPVHKNFAVSQAKN
jgi:hypothetical protein